MPSGKVLCSSLLIGGLWALSVSPVTAEPGKATACVGNSAEDEMVRVGSWCVDTYEASVWDTPDGTGTQYRAAVRSDETSEPYPCDVNGNDCDKIYAVSRAGVLPSNLLTWFQAQQACLNVGKQLLPNAIWQQTAAGTPDPGTDNGTTDCYVEVIEEETDFESEIVFAVPTGSRTACKSRVGAFDMVGNVEEWTADWMQANTDEDFGSVLPERYGNDAMLGVDEAAPQLDRFPAALFRGGFATSPAFRAERGVFTLNATRAPSSFGRARGFRCGR